MNYEKFQEGSARILVSRGRSHGRLGRLWSIILIPGCLGLAWALFLPTAFAQTEPTPIRLLCDLYNRANTIDLASGQPAQFYRGDDIEIDIGIGTNGVLYTNTIVNYSNIICSVFRTQNDTNAPLMQATVYATNLNTTLTASQWTNNASPFYHAAFQFTNGASAITLGGNASASYWLRIQAITTNTPARTLTLEDGPITVFDAPIGSLAPLVTGLQSYLVASNGNGGLVSPTNFFAANSNLLNQAIPASTFSGVALTNYANTLASNITDAAGASPSTVFPPAAATAIFAGDSLTAGYGVTTNWVSALTNFYGFTFTNPTNTAVSGITAWTILQNYNFYIGQWATSGATNTLAFDWFGINDISYGSNAINTFGVVSNIWYNERAQGMLPVAFTVTAKVGNNATNETERLKFNTLVRNASAQWDYLVDVDQLFPDPRNPVWSFDGIHYTNDAQIFLGLNVAQVLLRPRHNQDTKPRGYFYEHDFFEPNTMNIGTTALNGFVLNTLNNGQSSGTAYFGSANIQGGTTVDITSLDPLRSAGIRIYGADDAGYMMGTQSNDDLFLGHGWNYISNTPPDFVMTQAGQIGMGIIPINHLHVAGGAMFYSNPDWNYLTSIGSGLQLNLGASSGNTYSIITAYTAGGATGGVLSINPIGGNVGINTTTPFWSLTVNGPAIVSNNFAVGGTIYGNGAGLTNNSGNSFADYTLTNALYAQVGVLSTNATNYAASILQNSFNGTPLTNWIGALSTNETNYAASQATASSFVAEAFSAAFSVALSTNATNYAATLSTNATNYAQSEVLTAVSSAESYATSMGLVITNWVNALVPGAFNGNPLTNWIGALTTNLTNYAAGSQWGESTRTLSNLQASITVNSAGQITNSAVWITNSGGYTLLTSNYFARTGTNGSSFVLDTNGMLRVTNSAVNWMLFGTTGLSNYGYFYLNGVLITSGGGVSVPATLQAQGVMQANGGLNLGGGAITNTGAYYNPATVTVSGSSTTLDWSKGAVFSDSLIANSTITFANVPDAGTVSFVVTNTAAYSLSFTPPGGLTIRWANKTQPAQSTTATDVYTFIRAGAYIFASVVQGF